MQGSTGRGIAPNHQWRRILWSCRDTFRVQIGRLLVHTLSPSLPLQDRKEALEFVFDHKHIDILKESLSPGLEVNKKHSLLLDYSFEPLTLDFTLKLCFPQHGLKLSLYLFEMLHDHKDEMTKEEQSAVGVFMTSLKLCGHRCIPLNAPHKHDLLKAIKEVKAVIVKEKTGASRVEITVTISSLQVRNIKEILLY